eukprot:RCo049216
MRTFSFAVSVPTSRLLMRVLLAIFVGYLLGARHAPAVETATNSLIDFLSFYWEDPTAEQEILACIATNAERAHLLQGTLESLFESGYPPNRVVYIGVALPNTESYEKVVRRGVALSRRLRKRFPGRKFKVVVPQPSWRKFTPGSDLTIKLNFWQLLHVGSRHTGLLMLEDDVRFCHKFWEVFTGLVSQLRRELCPRFFLSVYLHQDTSKWPATPVKGIVYQNPSEFWGTQAIFLSAEVKAEFRSYIEYEIMTFNKNAAWYPDITIRRFTGGANDGRIRSCSTHCGPSIPFVSLLLEFCPFLFSTTVSLVQHMGTNTTVLGVPRHEAVAFLEDAVPLY